MKNLYPHQIEAIEKIRKAFKTGRAFLNADSLGLGKTRVACEIAKDFQRVLIVAPLSTFAGWNREAETVGLELKTATIMWPGDGAVLINYQKLEKFEEIGTWDPKRKTFEGKSFDLIIYDESHYLKNHKSKRFKIFQSLNVHCKHTLFLSATPGQSPIDLNYLKDVIGFTSFWPWVRSFEGITRNRWGGMDFKRTSPKDIKRLKSIISDNPFAIRRTSNDIAGWPELNRIIYPIQLNPAQAAAYNSAFDDYLEARQDAGLRGLHPDAYDMVAVGQFRKAISFIKVEATVDLAESLLEQGKVVNISCEYLFPAGEIISRLKHKGYRVALMTGDTLPDRKREILNQSYNDEIDVIAFTQTEGINLHQISDTDRERVQLDHDVRWSGLAQTQADGRSHRAGRYAPVFWLACSETIDERVLKVLKNRLSTIADINNDNDFKVSPDEFIFRANTKSLASSTSVCPQVTEDRLPR